MSIVEFLALIDEKYLLCKKTLSAYRSMYHPYNNSQSLNCDYCNKFIMASEYNCLVFVEYYFDNKISNPFIDRSSRCRLTLRDNDLEINDIVFYSSNDINDLANKFLYFAKNTLKLKEYLALL